MKRIKQSVKWLPYSVPDFKKLHTMCEILQRGAVSAQWLDLTSDQTEIARVFEELIQHEKFTEGREFAELVGLSSDKVSIMQVCCH